MGKLSLVIAVHNEEDNIEPLANSIRGAFLNSGIDYEVIFVDDGSGDNTAEVIREIADNRTILLELKRNFGQTAAIKAGIDYAEGSFIATLDGDLQNDPEDLIPMLSLLRANECDVVTGIRASRKDAFLIRKVPSVIANYIVRKVTGTNIIDNGCGIKIFKSELLKDIPLYGEKHRFLVSLAALDGAKVLQVNVNHHPRINGRSKYGLGRTLKVISDLILIDFIKKYEQKPMYLFGTAGVFTSLAGATILIWLLIQKLLGQDIWGRPVMILGVLLLFIGFQIISTGLILDMIIRKNFETNNTKPYKIKRIYRAEN
jgi:glycosyltransferase involved in cell wall biosynthesis